MEPHIHLDAAMTAGEPRWNQSGTLFEGIECWSERKASLTHDDVIDDPESRFLEVLAAEALKLDYGSRVTASHTFAMGSYNDHYCSRLFRLLKKSGLHIANRALSMCPPKGGEPSGALASW